MRHRRSRWNAVALFGIAIGALGCGTDYSQEPASVVIWDEEALLSERLCEQLRAREYPDGLAFAFRVVVSMPGEFVGASATTQFRRDTRSHPQPGFFEKRGVYFLLTEEPRLVQVRVGSELYLPALFGGVTAGSSYLQNQKVAEKEGLEAGTTAMLDRILVELPAAMEKKRRWSGLYLETKTYLWRQMNRLALPSDTLYSRTILVPFVRLRLLELDSVGSVWITFVFAGALLAYLKLLVNRATLPLMRSAAWAAGLLRVGSSLAAGLVLSLGSAGSVFLLAAARQEDLLALKQLDVTGIDQAALPAASYLQGAGLWLALLVATCRVALGFSRRSYLLPYVFLPPEQQEEIYDNFPAWRQVLLGLRSIPREGGTLDWEEFEKEPFTTAYITPLQDDVFAALRWFLLTWILLPRALGVAAGLMWVVPIARGLTMSLAAWMKRPKT